MLAKTQTLAVIAACVVAAQAQSSTPSSTATAPPSQSSLPAGIDDCILGCLTQAATQGACSSFSDLACVCTSSAFQSAALSCLQANCTAADVTTATQLQSQECAPYISASVPTSTGLPSTPAPSGSASSATASGAATTSGSATTSLSAPSVTTSSASLGLSVPFSFETVFGTLFASAGALLGAAFVL